MRSSAARAAAAQTGFPEWVEVIEPGGNRSMTSREPMMQAMGRELEMPLPQVERSGTMP